MAASGTAASGTAGRASGAAGRAPGGPPRASEQAAQSTRSPIRMVRDVIRSPSNEDVSSVSAIGARAVNAHPRAIVRRRVPDRTLVVSATNALARGFLVVPTDRRSRDGAPVNGLFAVARAVARVVTFKMPARAVAVVETEVPASWPELLRAQLEPLPGLLSALGLQVVEAAGEPGIVASYAQAALDRGDDAIVVGADKRYAQLVNDRLWWYDSNKDVRYTA